MRLPSRETHQARGGTLVLGGGFAGASVAREIGRDGCSIVSPHDELLYTPLLAEAAAGEVGLSRAAVPLAVVCPHAEFVRGRATGLDRRKGTVAVETPDHATLHVRYEHLVVALGAVSSVPALPGHERLLFTRTIADVSNARDHVLRQLEFAAAETDPDVRARHLTFVVVGGGYGGVEMLSGLHALARDAARNHRALRGEGQRWVLVEAGPRILGEVPGRLGTYVEQELVKRGVEIRTETTLSELGDGGAVLADGTRVETETVIWTAGASPNPLAAELGLPVDDAGRIRVRATLQVEGDDAVWAAGDCAAVPNAATPGQTDPPTSQHALRQARRMARNIAAVRAGRSPAPYRFLQLGQVATLGRYNGVADVLGLHLSGLPGWAAARTTHLLQYPDPLGRLFVLNDWALSALVRRDTRPSSAGQPAEPSAADAAAPDAPA